MDEAVEYPQTTYNWQLVYRLASWRGGGRVGEGRGGGPSPPCLPPKPQAGWWDYIWSIAGRWHDVDYSFSGGRVVERVAFERMVIVERSQSRVRRI